ncbi:hypothetical protein RIVM261_048380 [Rivularia sp. IAM M-261]|nr:hypothetical protein RIVM261_048380 [Rivularia sp. IAM M-261]
MAITLEHFCTKTLEPITVNGLPLTETIEHCLAEYFASGATYKVGIVYPALTKEADLQKLEEQGLSLEFAASERFYFMDKALRNKLFDQPHFGAAYGSNMFTPCESFSERENLRVLVVDASTGENGGVMPPDEAIKLVGDGDGKIDARLHHDLSNQPQTPFQARFGIKERCCGLNTNNKTIDLQKQIGKGTFAPRDLSSIGNGYDLIISTDQLKGRGKGEREIGRVGELKEASTQFTESSDCPLPLSPTPPFGFTSLPGRKPTPATGSPLFPSPTPLVPGEYTMTMGIGNKTDAYYGVTSTGAQFWNLFPEGVKGDVVPRLEQRLLYLKDIASDPRKIAQDYIDTMDAKYKYQINSETEPEDLIDFENLNLGEFEKLIDDLFGDKEQDVIYRVLKADLSGHYQLLEHPKIVDKLFGHWRSSYMDCATGRFIKFDSAMAQTCHDLAPNEVCYPNFPDGAELIVYRSPVANSNTVDIYINRHLPDDPKDIGTIKLSPIGLKHSLSDCDGDRMAIALASEFPHTAAEIKQKQLTQNRYAEIVKPQKKAYTGSFEQIALDAMENKIGLVANLCMKAIALENECLSTRLEDAWSLIRDISCAATKMLRAGTRSHNAVKYPENIKSQISELSHLCLESNRNHIDVKKINTLAEYNQNCDKRNIPLLSPEYVSKFLEKAGKFYHDLVGILGGQLQIEVDRGKSANRSDASIVNACSYITKCFDIATWVEERKVDDVYTNRAMNIKGNGAIDIMAKMTNSAFSENALLPRSTQQFQDFFKGVEFTAAQKEQAFTIKRNYDILINKAIEISKEVQSAPGPRIIATSPRGNQLEIIGIAKYKHPNAFDDRKLDIKIIEDKNPHQSAKSRWLAFSPIYNDKNQPLRQPNGEIEYKQLGYIAESSVQKHSSILLHQTELKNLSTHIVTGLAPSQVKAAFSRIREYAQEIRESIPDSEKQSIAAAMWQISTANKEEYGFKKTSAVFAIFPDELIERLAKLQLTEFAIVGAHKTSNEHLGRTWQGEKVECSIIMAPDPANPAQNKRWLVAEEKKLGVFRSESAQLPIGTSMIAEITSPPSASVIITSTQGNQLKVGQLKKYAFADFDWKGEQGLITINTINEGKAFHPIALVDGKPLGVIDKESFGLLSQKLAAKNLSIQGFKFQGTLESAPATIVNIKVEPQTVKYPEVWTREQALVKESQPTLLDELKLILKDKYQQKINIGLIHDSEASLGAVMIKSDDFQTFMQQQGKEIKYIKALAALIDQKLGEESFIGIARKQSFEELYFCVNLPIEAPKPKTANRISDTLNFPLEYDQLEDGKRTKFIAIPLNDLEKAITQAENKIKQHNHTVTAAFPSNQEALKNPTDATPSKKKVSTQIHTSNMTTPKQIQSSNQALNREDWENAMLKLALGSLKANPGNIGEEIQTATFGEGKYRVVHHAPSELLRIVDELADRGTLYKAQKGKPATICEFSNEEKKSFEQHALTNQHKNLQHDA